MSSIKKNKIDQYKINDKTPINSGVSGTVFPVTDTDSNKEYAVKRIFKNADPPGEENVKKSYQIEIKILKQVKSDNVVSFVDTYEDEYYFYIVLERCEMNLTQFIKNNQVLLKQDKTIISIFADICNGLLVLYSKNYMHRDLKTANILMQGLCAKIADFGVSTVLNKTDFTSNQGSPAYQAPQIRQGSNDYSQKVDIWALGIILYQMISGKTPEYTQLTGKKNTELRKSGRQKFMKSLDNFEIHTNIKDVIIKCLQEDQKDRISQYQLIKHKIFEGDLVKFLKNKRQQKKPKQIKKKDVQISEKSKIQQEYQINERQIIGRGAFATVYCGYHKQTKNKVAIRQIINNGRYDQKMQASITKNFQKQILILKSLKSENVVSFINSYKNGYYFYIVMELCDMTLADLIQKQGKLEEKWAVSVFTDICNGYFCFAKKGYTHRNLKPNNILMKGQRAKISSFGLSSIIDKQNLTQYVGTPAYMAPQMLQYDQYTQKIDIWALGIILYQMIYGKRPFKGLREIQQMKSLALSNINYYTGIVIQNCLKINPEERISWQKLSQHPIFQGKFKNLA